MKSRAAISVAFVLEILLGGCDGGSDTESENEWNDVPPEFVAEKPQIRLLSAFEYRNTVRDLLGVEVSTSLDYGDRGSGFDNGGDAQLDENLLSVLFVEAERAASEYVASHLATSFPCFEPGASLDDACVTTIVDELGRRAFRRPLDTESRSQLLDHVARVSAETTDGAEIMRLLVTRLLMSPRFLYRTELGQPQSESSHALLDPFERASLLSYSLIGSMPDEPLLADAESDKLGPAGTREHVRRLLGSERGRAQMVRFFQQWLRVTELDFLTQAIADFGKLASADQATALRSEFGEFIEASVFDGDGTLSDLLTRNVTFVNRHTAALYGATSDSDELSPLELDPAQRGGVLTLASVMAVHSSSTEIGRDKPIQRGLLIKNQLLCEDVGFPSGLDLSAATEVIGGVPDFDLLTTREQLEIIMEQEESCVACHSQFMPLGYLLSNFDALGQHQTEFGGRPLDSSVDGLMVDGRAQGYSGIMELVPVLASSGQVSLCFATQLARYATGRARSEFVSFFAGYLNPGFNDSGRHIPQLIEDAFSGTELYLREGR
jgi:hypothetical protein